MVNSLIGDLIPRSWWFAAKRTALVGALLGQLGLAMPAFADYRPGRAGYGPNRDESRFDSLSSRRGRDLEDSGDDFVRGRIDRSQYRLGRDNDSRSNRNRTDRDREFDRDGYDSRDRDFDRGYDDFPSSRDRLDDRDQPRDWDRDNRDNDRQYNDRQYDDRQYDDRPSRVREPARRPSAPRNVDQRPSTEELISRRYQDPSTVQFISSLPPDRALQMYSEVLELVQTRHLEPPQLASLVERGLQNVSVASGTPAFLQVSRATASGPQVQVFQQTLGAAERQLDRVQDVSNAVTVAKWTMKHAQQQLQIPPQFIAIEFVYGAVESLDRFSAFVPPQAQRIQNQQLGENVVGIGVQVEAIADGLRVLKVMQGGAAQSVGVQKGDVIAAVNGRQLAGLGLDAATDLITGPAGSPVVLSMVRQGRTVGNVTAVRKSVQLRSVEEVQMLDPQAGVAYMKLETFAANSAKEMEAALWQLHQQGMQSLVLDLRGDPGGLLTTAIDVASLFVKDGTIVSTRGRTASDNSVSTSNREQVWRVPLVVVVDEHSASASEILAAAVQENGRGLIVGRHSYGKGTVQTLFPLQTSDAGLRLTTALFYSPNGRAMAGEGVEPDVLVSTGKLDPMIPLVQDVDIQTAVQVARQQASGMGTVGGRGFSQPSGPTVPSPGWSQPSFLGSTPSAPSMPSDLQQPGFSWPQPGVFAPGSPMSYPSTNPYGR